MGSFRVQEKWNHWLNLNHGRPFNTKEEAHQYLAQYKEKHPRATLRIVVYEYADDNTVTIKEV